VRYGFIVPKGDPHTVADLAREAEEADRDGVFHWHGIWVGEMKTYDSCVVMAAIAMRTERVRLTATPGSSPARRRPWTTSRVDAWSCRWG
jgi:alkanesulfonate monooxygenase SsuD/methylene tetrahydromethanopterin reductase-like flavin-dependent oxidoreductase (luciferase family)